MEDGRLPKSVKPLNYKLTIEPDLHALTFRGRVAIELIILQATDNITLHALGLDFSEVLLNVGDQVLASPVSTEHCSETETVSFTFAETLPAKAGALLQIKFSGVLGGPPGGFFYARYRGRDGALKNACVTQFQATDARRALPCFDEPALKATFDMTLVCQEDLVALSNMDVKSTSSVPNPHGAPQKAVTFNTTPPMSVYLLAFAVGQFDYAENKDFRIPIRVYSTIDKSTKQGQYAADLTARCLTFFEEQFGIAIPIAKMDSLALADKQGAMENLGLVTYAEGSLLYDPQLTSLSRKASLSSTIAHELSHQWFGDIVTMAWWNGLWLNESFATWASQLALDQFYPKWEIWSQYSSVTLQQALTIDSLHASHPIEMEVKSSAEIGSVFDAISYQKGGSVLRMLSMHLGEDLFLKGVSQYLKAHAFANAETTDLWKALSDVSGQGISSMMSTWTKNVGHPVLTVTESGSTIHITQNRYLRNGPPTSEEDEVIWPVLLNFRTGEAHNNPRLMNSRSIEMALPTSDFYKLNAGHTGVYRVLYPPSRLAKLAESARTSRLSSADRSGLLFDAVSLTQSGHQTLIVTLDLAQALSDDSSSFVWQAQTKWYNALQSTFLFSDDRIKAGIIKLQRKVFAHKSRKLRPEVGSIRDVLDAQFKANVFLGAGLSGDRLTIASAKHMFHNGFAVGYRGAIKIDLRSAVFKVILNQQYEPDERNRSEYDYDVIVRELETGAKLAAERAAVTSTPSHACQRPRYYTGARTADERIAAASALGYAHSPALVQRSIALVLEKGRLNLDELHAVLSGLTTHVEGNMALLNTILTRFEEWKNRFGVGLGGLTFVLPILLGGFATYEHADQLGAFFRTQDVGGNGRELAQALEEIRIKAAWAERDGPALLAWLESNGFA